MVAGAAGLREAAAPNRSARRWAMSGETKLDTSPPREAISLTSFEEMKWCRSEAIRNTVSTPWSSLAFMPAI